MAPCDRADDAAERGGDSLSRVRASLTHREPDRIPLDIGGTRVSGIHRKAYSRFRRELGLPQTDAETLILYLQLARVEGDFRRRLGVDLQSVDPSTSAYESPVQTDSEEDGGGSEYTDMWGCDWLMTKGGEYFDINRFPLSGATSIREIEKYPWPRGDSPLLFSGMQRAAEEALNQDRRAVVLGRTCPGIFEMCFSLCGHEKAMMDFAADPSISEAIMEHVLAHKLEYYGAAIERLLAADIPYFIISESDDLGSQNGLLISPQMYRSLVKPRHARLFSEIKRLSKGRAFIELHTCGAVRALIPDLLEAGVEILNPVQLSASGMEPGPLKREFGSSLVFHGGGIDSQHTLPHGTPQEVRDEVKRRIDEFAPGGGFIFTPVHSIQGDVPEANFMAMMESYYDHAGR
jgi:uroporphyrinogen decarboxylase